MLIDYHLHTVYSNHAVGTIDDYLRRAEELGSKRCVLLNIFPANTCLRTLNGRFLIPGCWMKNWSSIFGM